MVNLQGLTKVTATTKVPYCRIVKFKQCVYSKLIHSYIYIGSSVFEVLKVPKCGSKCSLCWNSVIYKFSQECRYVVLGIHDPGRDGDSHVKVTICTGWFPKVLTC